MTAGFDPYWTHADPGGCQEAEAKLRAIAVLCDRARQQGLIGFPDQVRAILEMDDR